MGHIGEIEHITVISYIMGMGLRVSELVLAPGVSRPLSE